MINIQKTNEQLRQEVEELSERIRLLEQLAELKEKLSKFNQTLPPYNPPITNPYITSVGTPYVPTVWYTTSGSNK